MLERLFALETFGIKLGLDNITRLCAALGHPERTFRAIHVAGTNGKGSVTAMVHAALIASGIRSARYTSPHLVDLSERFVIGDEPVAEGDLLQAVCDVLDCADRLRATGELPVHPTFFEATTAVAFELFRRARTEVAVIEVGLGGRFDSTNVIAAEIGAITSIGFDHQQFLGHTLEAIAFEKAGIITPAMDIVTGALPEPARRIVAAVAAERRASLIDAADDVAVSRGSDERLVIETPDDHYGPLALALRGEHQIGNAAVAIRLLEAARRRGIAVSKQAIERGLTTVHWPGRLELLRTPEGGRILLDAAHNVDGARALAHYLGREHPERPALVFGAMRDKDVDAIMHELVPVVSSVVATAADTTRAIPAVELAARIARAAPGITVHAEPSPLGAVDRALSSGRTVCVAGSIFLVGEVRDGFKRRAILR